jgi:hypothetical protein
MNPDPGPLLDRSIAVLESLAASFAGEIAGMPAEGASQAEDRLRHKELLLSLSILLPKLRAARNRCALSLPGRPCPHCFED